tara:strand:+ start:11 stop:157 length:147 start_codon:yes stop_codon:yes gene_type:complete
VDGVHFIGGRSLYRSTELIENHTDIKSKGVGFGGLSNYSFEDGVISGP